MKINDSQLFSVVIPTYEGTRFLKRALNYFRRIAFEGRIVLSDNSSGDHRKFVASCDDEYADLWIEIHSYPEEIRFLDKVVASLEKVESQFVMLHAHDDFMVPETVELCVNFLDRNPSYSVARGRTAMFALSRGGDLPAGQIGVSIVPHPMRGYEQDDAIERLIAHIERYASSFYSVHRRLDLIESFRITESETKNVIFFQYLSSCISALKGKIWCAEDLFYIRQGHADSWSGRLKQGNYDHWPMLITSPDFSRHYQDFRGALGKFVQSHYGLAAAEIGQRIDLAAVSLFRRSYCGTEFDNPEEVHFLKRLNDPASRENALLSSVVDFIIKHPETF